jgi:hypothetical protein
MANHGDNSADEFPCDCSFLGGASKSEDLKISQDDDYKYDYEGLVFFCVPKYLTKRYGIHLLQTPLLGTRNPFRSQSPLQT